MFNFNWNLNTNTDGNFHSFDDFVFIENRIYSARMILNASITVDVSLMERGKMNEKQRANNLKANEITIQDYLSKQHSCRHAIYMNWEWKKKMIKNFLCHWRYKLEDRMCLTLEKKTQNHWSFCYCSERRKNTVNLNALRIFITRFDCYYYFKRNIPGHSMRKLDWIRPRDYETLDGN